MPTTPARRCALLMSSAAGLAGLVLPAPTAAAAGVGASSGITHVWQIELENEGEASTYPSCASPANVTALPDRYLDCTLRPQGVFLQNYYATGHVSLDNYLAQAAGVPFNASTASDCDSRYYNQSGPVDVGGAGAGVGCVYPKALTSPATTANGGSQSEVTTIYDQLTAAHETWQGLMEDMGFDANRETATCGVAKTGGTVDDPGAPTPPADGTNTAEAADQYAARHNPFVWFHSLLDSGACAANVAPLGTTASPLAGLTANLQNPPSLTFISPNLCDDGHDTGCAGPDLQQRLAGMPTASGPGGLKSIDGFLSAVVPLIQASPAYQDGKGMIAITFDEGGTSDTAACCGEPTTGGGLVGALLLSKSLTPGTSTVSYNHYSLLRSYEDLFGITTGGADGKGHLLEAAAANSFGPDVYAAGATPPAAMPELPLPALGAAPLAAAGYLALRRSRRRATR